MSAAFTVSGFVLEMAPWPPRARKLLMMLSAPAKSPTARFASVIRSLASSLEARRIVLEA